MPITKYLKKLTTSFKVKFHKCDNHWESLIEMIHGLPHKRTNIRVCNICNKRQFKVYCEFGDKRFDWEEY